MLRECLPLTMSGIRCQVSGVVFFNLINLYLFFYKVLELVGVGSVINGAYQAYFLYSLSFKYFLELTLKYRKF